jgi:regulatory protein
VGGSGERKKPRGTARDRALNLLSFRDRSRREIEQRLLRAGFEPDDVADALEGLERVGLVDDDRFARAVVEQHAERRLSGRRAVAAALTIRGVDRETAATALAGLDEPGAERARAEALARSRAQRLSGYPPEVALRRLSGLLARRGYPAGVCWEAARSALALADEDEDEDEDRADPGARP